MKAKTILGAIGSTEETTFGELCLALGDDKPEERSEWADLFNQIRILERDELVKVSYNGNQIDSLILTEAGVAELKK